MYAELHKRRDICLELLITLYAVWWT